MKSIIFSLCLLLTSCDAIKDCLEERPGACGNSKPTPSPTIAIPSPTALPMGSPTKVVTPPPVTSNPTCGTKELDASKHLLWKPVSDSSGNAVIVFDGKYKQEFLEVKAETKAGGVESAFWKPLILWGNPDSDGPRQHWRLRQQCQKYKDKGLIIADDGVQVCKFRLQKNACIRQE